MRENGYSMNLTERLLQIFVTGNCTMNAQAFCISEVCFCTYDVNVGENRSELELLDTL